MTDSDLEPPVSAEVGHTAAMKLWGATAALACALVLSSCSVFSGNTRPSDPPPKPIPGVTVTETVTATPMSAEQDTQIVEINPLDVKGTVRDAYNLDETDDSDYSVQADLCAEPSMYGSSSGTYACAITALSADACWLEPGSDLVCIYYPWSQDLYRVKVDGQLKATQVSEDPQPLALELTDGSRYRARNSAGNSTRADGLSDLYQCAEGPCKNDEADPWILGSSDSPAIDKTLNVWTAQVGSNTGEPETRDVTRAWFIAAE